MSKKAKALIVVVAALVLFLVGGAAYFLVSYQIVRVPTGAMANTIIPGDRVLCGRRIGEIKRGDIVMFKLPTDPKVMYIKRVIGLPGETIQVKGRRVFINGAELPEERAMVRLTGPEQAELPVDKVEPKPQGAGYRVFYDSEQSDDDQEFDMHPEMAYGAAQPYQIPQGHYFLLGDCRDNSQDSRYLGTVPRELITGKAIMIIDSKAKGNDERLFKTLK
ncbi:MAG TPA: signal peptidase I [Blastocatellia bacterium]|nr:signal peptidase I [Blastocatellia bacterium]